MKPAQTPSALLLLLTIVAMAAPALGASEPGPRIVVGPDHLVSRDGEMPHVEPMVAVHPDDPQRLLAGAIVFTRPDRDSACRAYVSRDGGSLWTVTGGGGLGGAGLGELAAAADPQVLFTPRGTALIACLTDLEGPDGRTVSAIGVHRSEDGGLTWDGKTEILDGSYDHPQIAVDRTDGPHRGTVYLGVLTGREYQIGVLRSEDDGRSFSPLVEVDRGGPLEEGRGMNVTGVGVLSDGTVLVYYMTFSSRPSERNGRQESGLWVARSEDGGRTFGEGRQVATRVYDPPDRDGLAGRVGGFPTWAVDRANDRIHQTWSDWATGSARVVVSSSPDGGRTWSEPRQVAPDAPAEESQFLPALAVDGTGTLGVSWSTARFDTARFDTARFDTARFDTARSDIARFDGEHPESGDIHRWFSASVDGGVTFLPPRRLSSGPSRPATAINQRPVLAPFSQGGDALPLVFVSAYDRWPGGGDYAGLAAGPDGTFHALWPDARDGAFQLWSARARVELEAPPPPTDLVAAVVTPRIELVSDPAVWDPETREIRVPIRLKNVSDEPIYPPLEVVVQALGWGRELPEELADYWREREGKITNADDGGTGAGARFDYSGALGDLEALPPGGLSGARLWRIHQPESAMPPVQVEVRGRVVGEGERP